MQDDQIKQSFKRFDELENELKDIKTSHEKLQKIIRENLDRLLSILELL